MRSTVRTRVRAWIPLPSLFSALFEAAVLCGSTSWSREALNTQAMLQSLRQGGGAAGFCLHLGCGDGRLTAELARSERLAIHGFANQREQVRQARALLQSHGVYGQAVVEEWNAPYLPLADNLVNVVVAEEPGPVPEQELLRVLAPMGILWLKRDGRWHAIPKPWSAGLDEWTHWRHGADGNMVSRDTQVQTPTGVRWVAGPAQDAGGRKWYYDHVLVSAAGRNFYVYEDTLVARDAFNGRLLWSRPAKAYIFKESGTLLGLKIGTRTSKVRPVATRNRLYVALDGQLAALDPHTGETLETLAGLDSPREIAVVDNTVLLTDKQGIRAFGENGKLLWSKTESARRLVAGDDKIFYLNGSNVVCLDLKNGREAWRAIEPKAAEAVTCSYFQGVLVLERSSWKDDGVGSGLVAFGGESGKLLWHYDYIPGMTHWKEARSFFADELVWVELQAAKKNGGIQFAGFDPQTGKVRREVGTRGLHCSVPIATEQYFIASELEFTDIKTGERSRARMVKGACRLPFIPANGLLYTFPVQCECFPMLRGYMGLSQTPASPGAPGPRLERGRAFGVSVGELSHGTARDWPMYRRDSFRSGSTPDGLEAGSLKQRWVSSAVSRRTDLVGMDWEDSPYVQGPVTPPVAGSGLLLVAAPHQHRVVALDATTGSHRWTYTAGGRVDTSPTLAGNFCIFGAHDGYVYCLRLGDGELVWRFRAAPQESRIAAYGQLESPWPVTGSVLVEDGKAYAAAGRHPNSDGGVVVLAIGLSNGELAWEKRLTDTGVTNWYAGMLANTRQKVGVDFDPVDLLVRDGQSIAMSRWQFNPANGDVTLCFDRTNYQAFGSVEVPRGPWGYGIRQTKLVLDKPPLVFNAAGITRGATNETALLLAGSQVIRAREDGTLSFGDTSVKLESAVVRDGLIAARGRLYATTQDGKVYCFAGVE